MPFTAAQVDQLLQPIRGHRVLPDGKGNSHLPQQDVLAHLTRVFGFGAFDFEMLSCEQVFEQEVVRNGRTVPGRYDVTYRASMRLTVRDPDGNTVCRFEDGSTGSAENQKRGDAHDLAMKSAISLAKKRCAIALGDQFGLSLYNKGQMTAYVKTTLIRPAGEPSESVADVQEGTSAALSMGHDEVDHGEPPADADGGDLRFGHQRVTVGEGATDRPSTAQRARQHIGMQEAERARQENQVDMVTKLVAAVKDAPDRDTLNGIWAASGALPDKECDDVRALCKARAAELAKAPAA